MTPTWWEVLNLRELAPMALLLVLMCAQSYTLWRVFKP